MREIDRVSEDRSFNERIDRISEDRPSRQRIDRLSERIDRITEDRSITIKKCATGATLKKVMSPGAHFLIVID